MSVFILRVLVRSPVTGDSRDAEVKFDPANLDAAALQRFRVKVLGWCTELDAADAANAPRDL